MSGKNPRWLIMLYLSGDNNLSPEMVRAITEIGAAGIPDQVDLMIQFDPISIGSPTWLYALPAGTKPVLGPARGPLPLADLATPLYDAENSASPGVLGRFILSSLKRFPPSDNQYRLLVLSGHGSGADGDFLSDEHANGRFLRSMTIPRLRKALSGAFEQSKGVGYEGLAQDFITVLGMDSCLMSMVEVCYEVRDFARYLVGSEGFVPNAGWPYGYMLGRIREHIERGLDLEPDVICRWIVRDYLDFYRDYLPASVSVDIAACELVKLDQLSAEVSKLSELMKAMITSRELQNHVLLAHWRAQSFKREQHTDLWDFCDQLGHATRGGQFDPVSHACRAVQHGVENVVNGRQGFIGVDAQHAHGLAVYFPWALPILQEASVLSPYNALSFSREAKWGQFIEAYVRSTRREPRKLDGGGAVKWPADDSIRQSNEVIARRFSPVAATPGQNGGASGQREAPDESREAPDESRFLTQLLGSALPWYMSMKNPAQQVFINPGVGRRDQVDPPRIPVVVDAPAVPVQRTRKGRERLERRG